MCHTWTDKPEGCAPALKQYFSISHENPSDTSKARRDFINMCPVGNESPEMKLDQQSLAHAIADITGRCDAEGLNHDLEMWNFKRNTIYISNQLPDYCSADTNHADTRLDDILPKYVGTPEDGNWPGRWVEARYYDPAMKEYNAYLKAKREARDNSSENTR